MRLIVCFDKNPLLESISNDDYCDTSCQLDDVTLPSQQQQQTNYYYTGYIDIAIHPTYLVTLSTYTILYLNIILINVYSIYQVPSVYIQIFSMDGTNNTNISNDDRMVIYLKSINIGASSILSIEEHPIFAVPSINIHACEIPERLATMLHLNTTLDQSSHPDFLDSLSHNYHHPLF
jgi:hypothetical protein